MDVYRRVFNASRVDASVPSYGIGFTSLSLSLPIAMSVGTPTYHSVTI